MKKSHSISTPEDLVKSMIGVGQFNFLTNSFIPQLGFCKSANSPILSFFRGDMNSGRHVKSFGEALRKIRKSYLVR